MRIIAACIVAAFIAAPASAQLRRNIVGPPSPSERIPSLAKTVDPQPRYDDRLTRDLDAIHETIDDARDDRLFTRREARRLNRENDQIGVLANRYGEDGLSASEERELETRTQILRDQINARRLANSGKK